jgi:hypothetical protein
VLALFLTTGLWCELALTPNCLSGTFIHPLCQDMHLENNNQVQYHNWGLICSGYFSSSMGLMIRKYVSMPISSIASSNNPRIFHSYRNYCPSAGNVPQYYLT